MKIYIMFILFLIMLTFGCASKEVLQMKISSPDLSQTVPVRFTCDGENISPSLSWSDFPPNTKSFAIAVTDPDAPGGTWIHWLVYNIPLNKTSIAAGEVPGIEVTNDFNQKNYGGPCPPSGTHRYYFTVYALDIEDLGLIKNKSDFFNKVNQHTIAKAQIVAKYSRQR